MFVKKAETGGKDENKEGFEKLDRYTASPIRTTPSYGSIDRPFK